MVKLSTLCAQYLNEQWWLSESTKETTQRAFRYLIQVCGDLLIDRLIYRHGEQYKGWLLKYGSSKNTINMYLRAIKPVLNWAMRVKILQENPFKQCRQLKVTQRPIRLWEDYEVNRLLRFAPNIRWQAIILVARTTGLRRGALLNLIKDNIRDGYVFVEPKRNTDRTWEWEPKDKEIRKVPLIESLAEMLKKMDCFYPLLSQRRYRNIIKLREAGLLKARVRRCPDENFRRDFVAIQRRAFGRQLGDFHSLRKTYITEMLNHLPDHFVLRLSGHSDMRTLVTYYTAVKDGQYENARHIAANSIKTGHCVLPIPCFVEGNKSG